MTGSYDTTARAWDLATGEVARVFGEHPTPVRSARWVDGGQAVATCSYEVAEGGVSGLLHLWRPTSGQALHSARQGQLRLPDDFRQVIDGVDISPDGQLVAAACHNGAVAVWDAESGELL